MKIYHQDNSWAGSITVVANSMEEAIELMKDFPNYTDNDPRHPIVEHEIVPGLALCNVGDL